MRELELEVREEEEGSARADSAGSRWIVADLPVDMCERRARAVKHKSASA